MRTHTHRLAGIALAALFLTGCSAATTDVDDAAESTPETTASAAVEASDESVRTSEEIPDHFEAERSGFDDPVAEYLDEIEYMSEFRELDLPVEQMSDAELVDWAFDACEQLIDGANPGETGDAWMAGLVRVTICPAGDGLEPVE